MDLRQIEAFLAVADELHFGRAAERLHVGQPSLSEMIQRLERELGAALFNRTTRRVTMTPAGEAFLPHATGALDQVAAGAAAVRQFAVGEAGTITIGVTPPAATVLGPHLVQGFGVVAPQVVATIRRRWLTDLSPALLAGEIDVLLTCGVIPDPPGIIGQILCYEPLQVALRPEHRLASRSTVSLEDLADEVLGRTSPELFPAWALAQDQALEAHRVRAPSIELDDSDLAAERWVDQGDVDWIMLIRSLSTRPRTDVVKTVEPRVLIPFTLQWRGDKSASTSVSRFVRHALTTELTAGWVRPAAAELSD